MCGQLNVSDDLRNIIEFINIEAFTFIPLYHLSPYKSNLINTSERFHIALF